MFTSLNNFPAASTNAGRIMAVLVWNKQSATRLQLVFMSFSRLGCGQDSFGGRSGIVLVHEPKDVIWFGVA